MKRRKKIFTFIITAFAVIILSVLIFLFRKNPEYYKDIIHAGVKSEIIIQRDKSGVPYVKALNMSDAYFAIGLLHAQDRLPLIEFYRSAANGNLSVSAGNDAMLMDKLALTIGFSRNGEQLSAKITDPYYEYLNSYVKGINAFKENFPGICRGISSGEWSVRDVLAVQLMLDWADSFLNNKELLFPVSDADLLKEIIPENLFCLYPENQKPAADLLVRIRQEVGKWLGPFQNGFGFFINSTRSEGKAFSGFSLDSGINVFPKWYPVVLSVNENRIDCITASGLPYIFYGTNEEISFSGFNIKADVQDFYLLRTERIGGSEKYIFNGTWNDFTADNYSNILDSSVAGDETGFVIRSSALGPVISDLNENIKSGFSISINYPVCRENYIYSLFKLPEAESIDEAAGIVRKICSNPKIYLFSDRSRALIAYSGKLPVRNSGQVLNSTDLKKSVIDLSEYVKSFEARTVIAGSGILPGIPANLTGYILQNNADRESRLRELLSEVKVIDSGNISEILSDAHSPDARQFLPVFMRMLEEIPIPSAKLISIYFNNWDLNFDENSVPATIYSALLVNFIFETLNDEKDGIMLLNNYSLLTDYFYSMINSGTSVLFDDKATKEAESIGRIFYRALNRTLRMLNKEFGPVMEEWKWGNLHKSSFDIPFREGFFWDYYFFQPEVIKFAGCNDSIFKSGIDPEKLKPTDCTLISGIYCLDMHLSFLKLVYPQTIDPKSIFYNAKTGTEFFSIDAPDEKVLLKILP